jgi:3-dehydroquinate dehydratase/shikimate dehydrogenase
MTLLIVPITAPTYDQAAADIAAAKAGGADAVELRLDYLADLRDQHIEALYRTAASVGLAVILTARAREEGGVWDADDMARISRLIELAPHGDLCDVELATWKRSANIRQKIGLAIERLAPNATARLILSAHDFKQRPANLARLIVEMNEIEHCDVAKTAFHAAHISETFEAFDLMHENANPVIAIAMGEAGVITRILAKKFGAFGTFAALENDKASAPGQITLDDMKNLYRWDAQDQHTAVYGVIGNPVAHSMGPAIHNAAFTEIDYNGVYVPLLIEPSYEHFADFLDEARSRPWFNLQGCSVTIPHKDNALRYARERGAHIEPLAERIGAVNTLTFSPTHVEAHNTDYAGALDALTDVLHCERSDLNGMHAAILGAGGVARALVAGLRDCGCRVTIYNRTPEKARRLAAEFDADAAPLDERVRPDTQIVVNGTSLGMHPHTTDTPLEAHRLKPEMLVFDTVYNPVETRLLREARELGCQTVDGVTMFVNQAAAQFQRWTNHPAPRDLMRQVVLTGLAAM